MRHHLMMALATVIALFLIYSFVASSNPVFRWSMATAYVGVALLGLTLAIGPLNVLRGRPNPVSTDLRRDLGIWAGLVATAHFLAGWQVHMRHRYLYWLRELAGSRELRPRADLFGFANYTGLAAVIIAILLLTLSNDYFLGRLGTRRWKSLQRWNYAFFALMLVHGIAYQFIEKRKAPFVITLALVSLAVLVLQYAGFAHRRQRTGSDYESLLVSDHTGLAKASQHLDTDGTLRT